MGAQLKMTKCCFWLIFLLSMCILSEGFDKVKVYSFGATRQRPLHLRANAEKALDWDDLDCVRLDDDPIEVPSKYTWCSWYMMDMLPPEGGTAINVYSILSSLTGNSMLEDSVNRTLDTLMSHTRVGINGHTLWGGDGLQYHHWGDLWGNLKPIDPPILKKWRSICIGHDSLSGSVIVYNDGELIDQTVVGDYYQGAWERNKNKTYNNETLMATDIMFGCWPYWTGWLIASNSFGRISKVHWFKPMDFTYSFILTHDEMIEFTTCSNTKLKGNILDWDTAAWKIHGHPHVNVKELYIPEEEFCPRNDYGGLYIPIDARWEQALSLCELLGLEVISILDHDDYEKALYSMCPWDAEGMGSIWSSFEDKDMDQNYEDYYTGAPWNLNVTKWMSGYPAKQAEDVIFFVYGRESPSSNTSDRIEMGEHQKWTNHKQIYCVGNSPLKKTLWVKVRGLCDDTKFDTTYYLAPFDSGYNTQELKFLRLRN